MKYYLRNLVDILYNPGDVCKIIKNSPKWLIPFILIVVVEVLFTYATREQKLNDFKDRIKNNNTLTVEEIDRKIENLERQKDGALSKIGLVTIPIVRVLDFILYTTLFFLIVRLLGSTCQYKVVFSLYSFSSVILIIAMVFHLPIILLKGTYNLDIDLGSVLSSLHFKGPIVDFLKLFNFFKIWQMVIVSIGLSEIYDLNKRVVISLSLICLILLLFGSFLFSGLIGIQ